MLEVFRNAAKSWVAKLLLGLLVVSFGAWGITDVFRGVQVQDLAQVGGQTVSGSDYQRAMNLAIEQYSRQLGTKLTYEDAKKFGIDKQVRDSLISAASLDEKAGQLGLFISHQSIAQEIANNPAFRNAAGQFDEANFLRILDANGINAEGYFRDEQRNRQRTIYRSASGVGAVPQAFRDAEQQFRDETRSVRYFTVAVDPTALPQPSADDLKKQYEATPQIYTAPEYRSVVVLKADAEDTASRFEISEEEIKNGFEKFKDEFAVPERRSYLQISFTSVADADKALTRIKAGEDFVKIAAELGFKAPDITFENKTKLDIIDPKVADTVFATALNAVSAPVQGSLTTAVIKPTAIVPGKEPKLEDARETLKKRLQTEKAAEDIQSIYDAVEEARSNQTKFEEIAARLNIPITIVPAVNAAGLDRKNEVVTLPISDELLKSVFESDVGLEQDALNLPNGFVWYEVREIIPSAVKPFKDVEAQVRGDWQAVKTRSLAEDKAKALVAKGEAGTSLDDLAKETGATIKKADNLKRGQATPEFDGLAAIALFNTPEKGFTYALEADGKSARIMQADRIGAGPSTTDKEAQDSATKEAKANFSRDMEETLLKAVRASVPATINEELWTKLSGASQ